LFISLSLTKFQKIVFILISVVALPSFSESINVCGSDFYVPEHFSSMATSIDWGIKIHSLVLSEENAIDLESMVEYEYGKRISYEEPVSLARFWQGCESYIGRQDSCRTNEEMKFESDYETLTSTLNSQGSSVNKYINSVMNFPYPNGFSPSYKGIPENMFNMTILNEDISSLGDFKQLSYRQAIRYKWAASQVIDEFRFENFQFPTRVFNLHPDLFVNTKTIIKVITSSSSNAIIEPEYRENRILLEERQLSWCDGNGCIATFFDLDTLNKEFINRLFVTPYENNNSSCINTSVDNVGYMEGNVLPKLDAVDEVVLHYEVQISIINTKDNSSFNPKDYMDRDLTLPPKKDAGSLYYLLLLFSALILFRRKQTFKAQQ
jgi:hypothetical protein